MATAGKDLGRFCATYGVELEPLAQALQLDAQSFSDFDARMSLDAFARLMEALSVVTGDDLFGLKYGLFYGLGGTGPVGLGMSAAPTFREMFRFFSMYATLIVDMDVFETTIEDDRFTVEWTHSPLIVRRDQFVDYSLAGVLRVFQQLAAGNLRMLEAQLERRAPFDKSLYKKSFGLDFTFEASLNQFAISREALQGVNPNGNPIMFDFLQQQCADMIKQQRRKKDIATQLKEDFIRNMSSGQCSISAVASRQGMSERTLQRRLIEHGTGFAQLFEETRNELSMQMLTQTDLPLAEVSFRLGYSSQSAYTRSVRRQHGVSPGMIRRKQTLAP
ncbi:AraC family transcriptional regulator [Roseobacter sp.]|uniref:AraC family transcriptional regulator n=1 Tax=Roseobacter sp. TaxID=1907202 RepID=UPI00385A4AAF